MSQNQIALKVNPNNQDTKHILKPTCSFCGKIVDVISEQKYGRRVSYKLSCGHSLLKSSIAITDIEKSPLEKFLDNYGTEDGKRLFKFQREGVLFGINSQARCLIADEMGLGKTLQAFGIYKYWCMVYNNGKPVPILVIGKAALLRQVAKENILWNGDEFLTNVITNPRVEKPWPKISPVTIISYDSLYRTDWYNKPEFMAQFKFCIIDEVQQIKNREAKRTDGVRIATSAIPHIIALSGTPIKNNASEYFSILNILKPERFNDFANYCWNYVAIEYTEGGSAKYGGIEPMQIKNFEKATSDFIIRRTEKDVDIDLPAVFRDYKHYDLGDVVKEAYMNKMKEFMKAYDGTNMNMNILKMLNELRHLTGYAKVDPTIEEIEEILLFSSKKIAIFTHHHDVGELMRKKLDKILESGNFNPCINAIGQNGDKSFYVDEFRKPENRVFIGTTLSCGEGLNIQFCDRCFIMEREWNPANEMQVEKRFSRIGATHDRVNATYPTAIGTIDEFFMKLVEKKRSYMASALDHTIIDWKESDTLKELADTLFAHGLDEWQL